MQVSPFFLTKLQIATLIISNHFQQVSFLKKRSPLAGGLNLNEIFLYYLIKHESRKIKKNLRTNKNVSRNLFLLHFYKDSATCRDVVICLFIFEA